MHNISLSYQYVFVSVNSYSVLSIQLTFVKYESCIPRKKKTLWSRAKAALARN